VPRRGLSFDPIAEAERQWRVHGWEDVAPAMAVVTSVMRAQQIFLGRIDALLRPLNLTFARYELLMLLLFSRRGSLPLGKIGERLQVQPASVTNAVDRLEDGGFVRRVPHPTDGRATLAELTPAGRRTAAQATKLVNDAFAAIGLQEQELTVLFDLLRKVRAGAGDFQP
jgi:DNA-binding MarR family transcriptional regulator